MTDFQEKNKEVMSLLQTPLNLQTQMSSLLQGITGENANKTKQEIRGEKEQTKHMRTNRERGST